MVTLRKSNERGKGDHGWLTSFHTFSFANYYDPDFLGFSSLCVINEDFVAPGKGFTKHPHSNMEILTYVIQGELAHEDSMGSKSTIKAGEVQMMSAGSGVTHSEYNASKTAPVHFLQVWVHPKEKNLTPKYQQKSFQEHLQGLCLLASDDGKEGSMVIHQEANIYLGKFAKAEEISFFPEYRSIWIQVIQGDLSVNNSLLHPGDGASVKNIQELHIKAEKGSSFLLFDLE